MWQGGAKRKKILRYLKEVSDKPIMLKDVSNMIAEMRQNSYTSPDDNVHVTKVLQDFSEGPGNVVNVFRDADKLHHFSDGPHETYRLFSLMLTDKFGSGAFAQHALINGETHENMKSSLTAFKRNNANWSDVKAIVIDKDFTELSTLEEEFPEAT
ncbi:hypothetical protein PI124_g16484 [Phytophthora idaei]|nr:hypothetical protein PI124_g16484 [Phytophthora idaei]